MIFGEKPDDWIIHIIMVKYKQNKNERWLYVLLSFADADDLWLYFSNCCRFDDVIAEALEAGPLRAEEYVLPKKIKKKLDAIEMLDKYGVLLRKQA